jgi:hypothetical protein
VLVLTRYVETMQRLQDVFLDATVLDRLEWCWTSSGEYISSSAYRTLFLGQHAIEGSKEL